jgi:hypothetical protein
LVAYVSDLRIRATPGGQLRIIASAVLRVPYAATDETDLEHHLRSYLPAIPSSDLT